MPIYVFHLYIFLFLGLIFTEYTESYLRVWKRVILLKYNFELYFAFQDVVLYWLNIFVPLNIVIVNGS